MLSHGLFKITSLCRSAFYRKCLLNRKLYLRTSLCNINNTTPIRSIETTSVLKVSDKPAKSTNDKYSSKVPINRTGTKATDPNRQIRQEKAGLDATEKKFEPLSSEELLEKYIAGLSTDIHLKNRVYKNDLQRVIAKVKSFNFSTRKQQLLLLRCCTELLPDEAPLTRMALAEEIWSAIESHTYFTVEHYNELLRVYLANNRTALARSFISKMGDVQPDNTTYELLLKVLGEAGDLDQATEVISNMKASNIPATETIFNSLIVCQGKAGNVKNIDEVLTMMTSLKLERSPDTYVAVFRALAFNKRIELLLEEFSNAYHKYKINFEERHIMEVVKTLAATGTYDIIPKILQYLPETTLKTPSISAYMQSVATHLVFSNHPLVALELYKCLPLPSFGPKDDRGLHGRSLVRDCVKASIPSSVIGLITQDLMATGRNPIALNNAAEAALQLGKTPLALDLFTRMKQMGSPLRPHYFWPILLQASKTYGEKGIMNTLKTMLSLNVTPDYDTVVDYALPYTSFTSPQNLMKKLLDTGVTVTCVLTPMMETLLNTGQVRAASELCELFEGKIDGDKLINPLIKGYLISLDLKSTVHILQDLNSKASDKSKDWVGRFLCSFIKDRKRKGDLQDFKGILKAIRLTSLKMSTSAADYCLSHVPNDNTDKVSEISDLLISITDEKLVDESEMFSQSVMHPKQMNEEALRSHLVELEAKGMNTRGVLRKLLQEYCRTNNLNAAREIVKKCTKEGVFLSAGMKASIFDLHVKLGELELAEQALADLNKSAPNFMLDEYKVIDFATLMVYRKKIDQAMELIKQQSKKRNVIGGMNISMNCWRLLDAVAANGTYAETRAMFKLLCSLGYCKPTNIIMGPLIRVHLKNCNLEEAVNEFVRIADTHSKTPLKHELLCRILKSQYNDGLTDEHFMTNERASKRMNRLVQTVLETNKKIHGASDVNLTLISALADVGLKKALRKTLLDPQVKFHPDAFLRRCERFADERKVKALETLAECANDLRHVDVTEIYDLILEVHQRDDACDKAIEVFNKMQDIDVTPSQKFVRNLFSMLKSNNKKIPNELSILISKDQAANAELNKEQYADQDKEQAKVEKV